MFRNKLTIRKINIYSIYIMTIEPPEILTEQPDSILKYNLETAQKLFDYLAEKLQGFKSLDMTPTPAKYLADKSKYMKDWEAFMATLEDQPKEFVKHLKDNHLSFYMIYMYNFCLQNDKNISIDDVKQEIMKDLEPVAPE